MTKSELVSSIAELTGMRKTEVARVLSALSDVVQTAAESGEFVKVPLTGVGTIKIMPKTQRRVFNPQTREYMQINYGKIKFTPAKAIKELLR